MDLKQLRALIAIAETGSVSRAAELLHIVQPAVSKQLRLLEEDLGAALFTRGRRGMELTASGELMVEHATRALRELAQAKAQISPDPSILTGNVTIGLLPSVSELVGASLVDTLKQRHPQLGLRITVGYAGHLQQWLENGEVDVALLYDPKPSSMLEVRALLDEALYLVGLPEAGLDLDRAVPLRDLSTLPMILPSRPHGLRLLLDHACVTAGIELSCVVETNAMGLQKNLVRHGSGMTVLPGIAVLDDVAQGRLSAAPITEPDLRRRVVLALRTARHASAAVRYVADELRAQIEANVRDGRWPGADWLRPD